MLRMSTGTLLSELGPASRPPSFTSRAGVGKGFWAAEQPGMPGPEVPQPDRRWRSMAMGPCVIRSRASFWAQSDRIGKARGSESGFGAAGPEDVGGSGCGDDESRHQIWLV